MAMDRTMAATIGWPKPSLSDASFQESMWVWNSAISPWAKLRIPVVRKMITRARATDP